MVNEEWVSALDADAACAELATAHADLLEVECRRLVLAAHWIDLHAPADEPDAGMSRRVLPGMERTVASGADGTPQISEFACAEFAALQGMHPNAGRAHLAKVANLRHRHPRLWARVRSGEVRGWKALEVARIVGRPDYEVTLQQARDIDEQTSEWLETLPWGAFLNLLEARIIAADPDAAEARRTAAEAEQFVGCGTEQGLKTFIAKALAGDVIKMVASCTRIAQILGARGDTRPRGERLAAAFGILANPAQALALLLSAQQDTDADDEAALDNGAAGTPGGQPAEQVEPPELGIHDLHPAQDDADDATEQDEPEPVPCPSCAGTGAVPAGAEAFVKSRLGSADLDKILPNATLYIHCTKQAFDTGQGVARVEGIGPITIGQVQEFLAHRNVRPVQVLDLEDQLPLDGYEFTGPLREAVFMTSPRDVFPFAPSTSRRRDVDHPEPYLPPDRGGPPGQTRLGNAAPMRRFHHRLKTFGRWRLRQPEPGTYVWRSPHGYYWLTTHTGSHPLPRSIGQTLWDALATPDNQAA
ncbi:MAG TPA: hypothetical protein VFT75_00855 [Nocardioidaceae bacterium]|jgi:hypothetical protein|nr:hypothetical protein [Nocardioidaceae bacterium]